jgi:hypothetical protein
MDKAVIDYIWREKRNIVNEHLSILKPYFSTIFPYMESEKLKKIATGFWETAFPMQQKAAHAKANFAYFVENCSRFSSLEILQTVVFTAPKALYSFFSKEKERKRQDVSHIVDLALKYIHENIEDWIRNISNSYVRLLETKLHATSELLSFYEKVAEVMSTCVEDLYNERKKYYDAIFDKFAELINFTNAAIYEGGRLIYSYKDLNNKIELKKLPRNKKSFLCSKEKGFILQEESKEYLIFSLKDDSSSLPQCEKILFFTFLPGEVKNFSQQQKQLLYLLLKLIKLKEGTTT